MIASSNLRQPWPGLAKPPPALGRPSPTLASTSPMIWQELVMAWQGLARAWQGLAYLLLWFGGPTAEPNLSVAILAQGFISNSVPGRSLQCPCSHVDPLARRCFNVRRGSDIAGDNRIIITTTSSATQQWCCSPAVARSLVHGRTHLRHAGGDSSGRPSSPSANRCLAAKCSDVVGQRRRRPRRLPRR